MSIKLKETVLIKDNNLLPLKCDNWYNKVLVKMLNLDCPIIVISY